MADLSNHQRLKLQKYEKATTTILSYQAQIVPDLGNRTEAALIDEMGEIKELIKDAEKVEKILKERLASMQGGSIKNSRGDAYMVEVRVSERTALNQTKAKEVLEEVGRLPECMSTSQVSAVFVKEL